MYKSIHKTQSDWMEFLKTAPSRQSATLLSAQAAGEPNASRHPFSATFNGKSTACISKAHMVPSRASAPSISINKMPVTSRKMPNALNRMSMSTNNLNAGPSKIYCEIFNKGYCGMSNKIFKASNGITLPQAQSAGGSNKMRQGAHKMMMGLQHVKPTAEQENQVLEAPKASIGNGNINKLTQNRTDENSAPRPSTSDFKPAKVVDNLEEQPDTSEQKILNSHILVDKLTIAEKIAKIPVQISKVPDQMVMMVTNMMVLAEQMANGMPLFPYPVSALRMPLKYPMYHPHIPTINLGVFSGNEFTDEADLIIDPINIKHYLKHAWTFWYLEKDQSKTWAEMQMELSTITNVEDFWFMYSHFKTPSQLHAGCDLSFFKNGIRPMWEDPCNRNGGRWVITFFRNSHRDLDYIWLNVMLCLIGDVLCNTNEICGAVVNLRGKNNKVSIWTANINNEAAILDIGIRLRKALHLGIQCLKYQCHKDLMKPSKMGVQSIYVL